MQGVTEISVMNIIFIMIISVFIGLIIGILIERKTSRIYREAYIEKSDQFKSAAYRAQLLNKWGGWKIISKGTNKCGFSCSFYS